MIPSFLANDAPVWRSGALKWAHGPLFGTFLGLDWAKKPGRLPLATKVGSFKGTVTQECLPHIRTFVSAVAIV